MGGHELAMALRGTYLAMHRATDAVMARSGVTADQFVVLRALAEGEALTQRGLAARTSTDPSTLRAMLVLLERRGLVLRRPHARDGRALSVSLSLKGKRLYQTLWRRSDALRRRLRGAFSSAEAAALVDQLRRLAKVMADRPNSVSNPLPDPKEHAS
jgi:DNA-binding MarR family transcriptional regulator